MATPGAAGGGTDSQLPEDLSQQSIEAQKKVVEVMQTGCNVVQELERGALPRLQALLNSAHASDVQGAIQLLKMLRHMRLRGADAALHGMLALIWAQDIAIRTAVLDAFQGLYVFNVRTNTSPRHWQHVYCSQFCCNQRGHACREQAGLLALYCIRRDSSIAQGTTWQLQRHRSNAVPPCAQLLCMQSAHEQSSPAVIANNLVSLLAGEHGTLAMGAAVQRCLALLLCNTSNDDTFATLAPLVATELLHLAHKHILEGANARPAVLQPRASERARTRDSTASGPSHTPQGERSQPVPDADARGDQGAGAAEPDPTTGTNRADAAFWLLEMLAAEQPECLQGMLPRILAVAFATSATHGRALLQKWALDIVHHLAARPATHDEVTSSICAAFSMRA